MIFLYSLAPYLKIDEEKFIYIKQFKVDRYERFVSYMFMNGSRSTDVKALDKQQQTKF